MIGKLTIKRVVNPNDSHPFVAIDDFMGKGTSNYYIFLVSTYDGLYKKHYEKGLEKIYTEGSPYGPMIKLEDDHYEPVSISEYLTLSDALKRTGRRFNKKKGTFNIVTNL